MPTKLDAEALRGKKRTNTCLPRRLRSSTSGTKSPSPTMNKKFRSPRRSNRTQEAMCCECSLIATAGSSALAKRHNGRSAPLTRALACELEPKSAMNLSGNFSRTSETQ